MGLKDLNIEFEDEGEKDQSNAIDPEVELNFGANSAHSKAGNTQAKVVNIKPQSTSRPVGGASGVDKEAIETILQSLTNSIVESEKEKRKYLVEIISESKLFEHKLNSVLNKLVKTAPQSKSDLILIKKLVNEFLKTINNN